MSNIYITDALAALKKEYADIGKAIAAVEKIVGTSPQAAAKAPAKPASAVTPSSKPKRKSPRKAACPVCGKKYVPGGGMAIHIRTQHPEYKK